MIVCICGSMRFYNEMIGIAQSATLQGYIVLMPFVDMRKPQFAHLSDDDKKELDDLHKSKIAMSDIVVIVNIDGYIGESTRSEIEYAKLLGKEITYDTQPGVDNV